MSVRLPRVTDTSRPRSQGFHARINDVLVRLAPSDDQPYIIQAPQAEAPRVDTAQTAEEFIGADGQVWGRSNFTGGEGLAFAHREDPQPLDRSRFWFACSLDAPLAPPGSPLWVEIGPAWATVSGVPGSHVAVVGFSDDALAVIGTTGFVVYDEIGDANGAQVLGSGALTTALDAAALDAFVYIVNGTTTVVRLTSTGTPTTLSAPGGSWSRIWQAKGRLFLAGATGGSLFEWQPGTDPVEVTSERVTDNEAWTTVVDAGMYIAAGASDGRIYLFSPSSIDNPELHVVSSSPMPQGEEVTAIAFNQGVLLVATVSNQWQANGTLKATGRVYRATVSDEISDMRLLRQFNDRPNPRIEHMVTTRDSIYWAFEGRGETEDKVELWRLLLPTGGLFRHSVIDVVAPVRGLANPGQIGAIATDTAVYLEQYARDDDGWMIMPAIDFFTASPKSWNEIRVSATDIKAGGEIEVLVSTDTAALTARAHPSWFTVSRMRIGAGERRVPLVGIRGRYLVIQVRLVRNLDLTSPRLLSVSIVGRTDDENAVQVSLPVIVSDRIERPYRHPAQSRGYGDALRQYLFDQKGRAVQIELFRPRVAITGTIVAIEAPVRVVPRRGHPIDIARVVIRGQRASALSTSQGGGIGTLGIGMLGVDPILGGVEA